MDLLEPGKRISLKRARPNPLFQSWLEELEEEAKQKKSKHENKITEALTSLSKYPLPLHSGAECAILKGFDKRLCIFLDKKLQTYNTFKGISLHSIDRLSKESRVDNISDRIDPKTRTYETEECSIEIIDVAPKSNSQVSTSPLNSVSPSKTNSNSIYKPSYGSGGYAILLALYEQSYKENKLIDKETLIEHAEKYCSTSFTIKKNTFYTAWASMGKLITKGLVRKAKSGKKTVYSLTDEGYLIARNLSKNAPKTSIAEDLIGIDKNHKQTIQSEYNSKDLLVKDASTNSQTSVQNSQIICMEMAADTFDIILLIDKQETSGYVAVLYTFCWNLNNLSVR